MKILLNILLNIIAIVLFLIMQVVNFFYVVFFKKHSDGLWNRTSTYFRVTAIALDRFGNANFKSLLNLTLIRNNNDGFSFGDYHETISSCLGKNQAYGNLTRFGVMLVWFLDLLDKNHCIRSIRPTPREIIMGLDSYFWSEWSISEFGEDYTENTTTYEDFINS